MPTSNFVSIRHANLAFCTIVKAEWLGKTWYPKSGAQFLMDLHQQLLTIDPKWYKERIDKAPFHPKMRLTISDVAAYYGQLRNGPYIKKHYGLKELCSNFINLIDELNLQVGDPKVVYESKNRFKQAA